MRIADSRNAHRARDRRGFTIIEVIMAMMILTVGLLTLASTAAYTARTMSSASMQTLAAQVAQTRFDSLQSINCRLLANGAPTTGTATTRGITEKWQVTDGDDIKNVVDTLTYSTYKGPKRVLEYRSVIACRD